MAPLGKSLADRLQFDPEAGRILLQDYRMVLLSACALGALRRELIETLGAKRARGAMKRFGHAAGLADGVALAELFPGASVEEHLDLGPALHAVEGVARVVRDESATTIDLANGHCHVEAWWEDSYEAEQHLELFGESEEPVCWTLVGYATGHMTGAVGERMLVVETDCRAMGADRCRFVADHAETMPEHAEREEPDYDRQHLPEVLQDLLDTVHRQRSSLQQREREIAALQSELLERRGAEGLVGDSPRFLAALDVARNVAPVDATVLVLGESGTGKEGVARLIHDQSLRRDQPFVAVNCSALPETLQEAELFGYAKGAFTGAAEATPGVFEAASGGTLFLDEIGDLALSAQTKILRALQEGEVKRLGETRTRQVDVRVVAATHRDLKAMIAGKSFREDLYYRLSVITIELPPLRERDNDRLLLAEHFLDHYAEALSVPRKRLSRDAKCAIGAHGWPGNVRELQHAIERGVILAAGDVVELDDLPPDVVGGAAFRGGSAAEPHERRPSGVELEAAESELAAIEDEPTRLRRALQLAGGNRERAARSLGLSRTTLWRRMRAHGIPIAKR